VVIYDGTFRNEVCQDFAVHARTTVAFSADGSTKIHDGDVGLHPGTSITGTPQFVDDGEIVTDSTDFAATVVAAHAAAIALGQPNEQTMAIEMGGVTFTPGIYRSGSAINFAVGTTVTLDGDGEYLFIAGTTLVTAANTNFILLNGASAANVLWALGTAATLGADSVLEGSILAGTAITFGANSEVHGCVLAQSAVTFASGGSVKPGNFQNLADVADEVKDHISESTQRFDLATLSLERSPNEVLVETFITFEIEATDTGGRE
jgi:hypothetical protein